jgi:glycosyltransferase involved in cell wall biosynthesis
MQQPLVSICIPTYNGALYLKEALQSVLIQNYPTLEIVISDDASIDGTLSLVEKFKASTNIPITVQHHIPNGIGANWNNCIKHAKGKYIKLLFQDDVLLEDCIETMVNLLEQDNSIGLVACKREFIIEPEYASSELTQWISKYGDLQLELGTTFNNGIGIIDTTLFKTPQFLKSPLNKVGEPPATMFSKKLLKKVGWFHEDLKQILDYEFYYRVLKYKKIAIIEKPLIKFRLHPQQATNVNRGNDDNDYVKYDYIIYKEYFWYLPKGMQKAMLKKYHPFVKFLMKFKRKIKSLI